MTWPLDFRGTRAAQSPGICDYGGETKEVRAVGGGIWTVHKSNGDPIESVIVRLKAGRYRFEKVA